MAASVVGGSRQLHVADSVVGGELACLALFACLALLACWLCLRVHLILEFITHRQCQTREGQPAERPTVNVNLLTEQTMELDMTASAGSQAGWPLCLGSKSQCVLTKCNEHGARK